MFSSKSSFSSLLAIALTFALVTSARPGYGQIIPEDDESRLYAQSKQLNQFFRRFNGEEDEKGKRFYPGDRLYRSEKLRKKFFGTLFDEENAGISSALKSEFARDILERNPSPLLDFHGGEWFAEVETTFTLNGKNESITLFMELEKAQLGRKWVIYRVRAPMFDPYFVRDTTKVGRFLHPLSHELDFMNLRKALTDRDSISQFAIRRFVPDHLSLLLYEISKGSLKFQSVQNVRFHFFQIPGWYFEVANFNREGYNTGWLISNLVRVKNDSEKDLLKNYLYK